MRRIDHDRLRVIKAEVEPDVGHVADIGPEEHQVTGLERRSCRHQRTGVVLTLGGAWDLDASGGVPRLGQARAVKARITVLAPDIRLADLCAGEPDRDQRRAAEIIGSVPNCLLKFRA